MESEKDANDSDSESSLSERDGSWSGSELGTKSNTTRVLRPRQGGGPDNSLSDVQRPLTRQSPATVTRYDDAIETQRAVDATAATKRKKESETQAKRALEMAERSWRLAAQKAGDRAFREAIRVLTPDSQEHPMEQARKAFNDEYKSRRTASELAFGSGQLTLNPSPEWISPNNEGAGGDGNDDDNDDDDEKRQTPPSDSFVSNGPGVAFAEALSSAAQQVREALGLRDGNLSGRPKKLNFTEEYSTAWLVERRHNRNQRREQAQGLRLYDPLQVSVYEAALANDVKNHRLEVTKNSLNSSDDPPKMPAEILAATQAAAANPWSVTDTKSAVTMEKLIELLTRPDDDGGESGSGVKVRSTTPLPNKSGGGVDLTIPFDATNVSHDDPFAEKDSSGLRGMLRQRSASGEPAPKRAALGFTLPQADPEPDTAMHDGFGAAVGHVLPHGMTIDVVRGITLDAVFDRPNATTDREALVDDAARRVWTRKMLIRSAALSASYKWLVYAAMHRKVVNDRYALADSADRFLHEIGPETEYWVPNSVEGVTDVWERVNNYIPKWAEMLASDDRVRQLFEAARATVLHLSEHGEEWVDNLLVQLRSLHANGGQPQIEDAVAATVAGFINDPAVAREAFSLNWLLTGLPGSGKTTIARKIARVFGACGILVSGDRGDDCFVEVGRGDLVAQWAGQTAPRVTALLTRNLERVVFFDEAYSLVSGTNDEVGQEALTALVQYMDQYKGQIGFIAAGYEDRIRDEFLGANPGLERRFEGWYRMDRLDAQHLFKVFWDHVDEHTAAFGGPLQIYEDQAYQLVQEFIARARVVGALPESIERLFHTQAAAAKELARRAIRYANEIRMRTLNGRLGALDKCSMARVLFDFVVSKIPRPKDRLVVERFLDRRCGIAMKKLCNANEKLVQFGELCGGGIEEDSQTDDPAYTDHWEVVNKLAEALRRRTDLGSLSDERSAAPRRYTVGATGGLVRIDRPAAQASSA